MPVLEEENVVAVGGTVRPSNDVELHDGKVVKYRLPKNILACMQLLEYDRSFLASRILFDRFNGILTLTAFFSRIQTIDLTVKPKDCFKAIMLCFFEVTTLRFIMAFVRLTAFKGYKKKKLDWGRIERKK